MQINLGVANSSCPQGSCNLQTFPEYKIVVSDQPSTGRHLEWCLYFTFSKESETTENAPVLPLQDAQVTKRRQ